MADFGLKIDGIDALLKVMDGIEKDMESANGRATLAGARVIMREARRLCPASDKPHKTYMGTYREPGNLKKSIKVKVLKAKEPGIRLALVGPAVGKREPHDGFYGVFVEQGHHTTRIRVSYTKNWKHKGLKRYYKWEYGDSKTQPRPFMRPAFDHKKDEARRVMAIEYQKAIEQKMDKGKALDALGDIIEGD
jgi:HK97 gp10 family phage protein